RDLEPARRAGRPHRVVALQREAELADVELARAVLVADEDADCADVRDHRLSSLREDELRLDGRGASALLRDCCVSRPTLPVERLARRMTRVALLSGLYHTSIIEMKCRE